MLVKGKRPVTAPNYGFMEQLVEYEQKLFDGTVTFDLAKYKQHRFKDASLFELVAKSNARVTRCYQGWRKLTVVYETEIRVINNRFCTFLHTRNNN